MVFKNLTDAKHERAIWFWKRRGWRDKRKGRRRDITYNQEGDGSTWMYSDMLHRPGVFVLRISFGLLCVEIKAFVMITSKIWLLFWKTVCIWHKPKPPTQPGSWILDWDWDKVVLRRGVFRWEACEGWFLYPYPGKYLGKGRAEALLCRVWNHGGTERGGHTFTQAQQGEGRYRIEVSKITKRNIDIKTIERRGEEEEEH